MGLIRRGHIVLIGPIRQELLSGIRKEQVFETLRSRLRAFPDEALTVDVPCAISAWHTAIRTLDGRLA